MEGFFIIHPRKERVRVDRDFAIFLHEWDVPFGAATPNPNTMLRDIELVADAPGDWAMHCHKTHHTMNQMAHDVPNLAGVDQKGVEEKVQALLPGYMAMGQNGMGDMFTVVKVRDGITSYGDPGNYQNPPGTVAHKVADEQREPMHHH